jgi:ribose transport system substrate-binding protein
MAYAPQARSRKDFLKTAGVITGATIMGTGLAPHVAEAASSGNEEYVWVSADANLPLFVAHDHPALRQAGRELGVKVTIAGPNTADVPGMIAALEQVIARKPTGLLVVGWDPSALITPINRAIAAGIPVICDDADVPRSDRLAFVGTDWFSLGVAQATAMVKALKGKKGKVSLQGLIAQYIDQQAFSGFKSVAEPAGLTVLQPQDDKGDEATATSVASSIIQATPGLVGMAGFDSQSGAAIGLAVKEAGKAGKIVVTCVDAELQQLQLVKAGVITAAIGQKRELFTYQGVYTLHQIVHNTLKFTSDDKRAGIVPIPINYNTGTYTATLDNVDIFLKGKK